MPEPTLRPDQVREADAARVLEVLNASASPEALAEEIEIPDELDIGVALARRILARRDELGGFTSLQQVADVPLIGPERFTEIVVAITGTAPPGDGGLAGEVAALRAEVRALRARIAGAAGIAGGPRVHVTLRRVNPRAYLGQSVTLVVEARRGPGGEPVTGLPVTLLTSWGEFHTSAGSSIDRERARTVRTGVDGRARVQLHPQSREALIREHQAALEDALRPLDPAAETPRAIIAEIRELVRRYGLPQALRFREAVDILVDGLGGPGMDPVVRREVLDFWPTVDATVLGFAREDGTETEPGSVVSAAAVLTLRFRNWLPAWLAAFGETAREQDDLDARLSGLLQEGRGGPAFLASAAVGRVRSWVEGHRGRVAEHFARTVAEEKIHRFLREGVDQLPLESRLSLRRGLAAATGTLATQGVRGLEALEQGQEATLARFEPIADDLRQQVDGLRQDVGTVESSLTEVTRELGDLAEHPALLSLRSSLTDVQSSLSSLETDVERIDGDVASIDLRIDELEPVIATVDTRLDAVDHQVSSLDSQMESLDATVEGLDSRIQVVDNQVETVRTDLGRVDVRLRDLGDLEGGG